MKAALFAPLAGAMALFASGIALAEDVIIAPEQETVIREYVKKKPLASINVPGVELNVGSDLPDTVELAPIDVPDSHYDYVVIDNRTYLVKHGTRKVIKVYE